MLQKCWKKFQDNNPAADYTKGAIYCAFCDFSRIIFQCIKALRKIFIKRSTKLLTILSLFLNQKAFMTIHPYLKIRIYLRKIAAALKSKLRAIN